MRYKCISRKPKLQTRARGDGGDLIYHGLKPVATNISPLTGLKAPLPRPLSKVTSPLNPLSTREGEIREGWGTIRNTNPEGSG